MRYTLLSALLLFISVASLAKKAKCGEWTVNADKAVEIIHQGQMLLGDVSAEYRLGDRLVSTRQYSQRNVTTARVSDAFGRGRALNLTYTGNGLPTLVQTFRLYPDFVLAEASIEAETGVSTNCIAPVVAGRTSPFFSSREQRSVFVPFDNDCWVRYSSQAGCPDTLRSYEVTTVYNADSRRGFVIGAISHDTWKNAIDIYGYGARLKAISGVADSLTRDHKAHGFVKGRRVSSATFIILMSADWRRGMEAFADANATVAPPRKWGKAMPVGWNSWGALAFDVNHKNSCEVSAFIADNLQNHSFHNADGLVYTGLDSGWNSFTEEELADFARQCEARHQVPCIYWTPFTDWGKHGETEVKGSPGVRYRDIWLYANGKPQELDGAYAIDPTHPAVKRMMETTADLFRRCGFKYVKMDFMTHGRMEADRWWNPGITTGTQAYNYGMQLLDSIFGDMYLNLSISPIFPAQYAQSRRIACDAWNKIKDTEYTLNALSWGWWVGRVYDYNDADHVVLRDAEEGENRARVTSSVITGIYITGDDFSKGGSDDVKRRARLYLTNPDINRIATGAAFMPLYGNDDRSENCFVRFDDDGTIYLACFNYTAREASYSITAQSLGLRSLAGRSITELWSHKPFASLDAFTVPPRDVKVFRITLRN